MTGETVVEPCKACPWPVAMVDGIFTQNDGVSARLIKEGAGHPNFRIMVVADANVVNSNRGLGSRIGRYFQDNGLTLGASPILFTGGEKLKSDNLLSAMNMFSMALRGESAGINNVVVAIGGGSLLDLAGYAAAQIHGGMRLVRVPTTLSSMVEGACTNKAYVNFDRVKSALAVDSRPVAAIVDPALASTCLDGVWRGGMGEIIRHAAVADAKLMKDIAKSAKAISARDMDAAREIVRKALVSRAKKGTTDFAVWCSHRLEELSAFKLPNGYAIAIAICLECAYSVAKGHLNEDAQELICRAMADCGALEGLHHSQHLIQKPNAILDGIKVWLARSGSTSRTLPAGPGKNICEPKLDFETYRMVLKKFLNATTGAQS